MEEKEKFEVVVSRLILDLAYILKNRQFDKTQIDEYKLIISANFPIEISNAFCDFLDGKVPNDNYNDIEFFLNKIIDSLLDSYNSCKMSEGNSKFFVSFINEIKKHI